jgi:Spy/CpxP family protein refolding chaperone
VIAGQPAGAEGRDPGTWWLSHAVQARMALTPWQVCKIDVIFRASLPTRRRLRQQLTPLRQRLDRVLADGVMDDAHARRLLDRVYAIERERNVTRTMMLFRIYQVLSPSQRETLADINAGRSAIPADVVHGF